LVLSKDQEPSGTGGSDIRYRESTVELDESAWRHKIAETSKVAVPPAPPPIPSNGMISRPLSSPSPHSKASVTGVRVCRPEHLVITLRRQGPFHNLRQIWTPCAARVVLIPRHLARTISLRLPVEQLRVNAIAFDETVKRIAPASAALVALDAQHIQLADDIAEYDHAVSGHPRGFSDTYFLMLDKHAGVMLDKHAGVVKPR
jgi:hypothetical protein